MSKVFIFPNENNNLTIGYPAPECEISVEEIARKDVPAGVPYLILDETDLPSDHTFFNAWEADFSNPDGHGIGADAWFAEQAEKSNGGAE